MSVNLTCRKHPKWKAIRKLIDTCEGCNLIWQAAKSTAVKVEVAK